MIIHLTDALIKASLDEMSQHFPKPYECFGGYIKILSDLYIHEQYNTIYMSPYLIKLF